MSTVIGIAGGTASGKSTLAQRVAQRLAARCLHIVHDRYYVSMPAEFQDRPTHWNFDHPNSLDTERLVADLDTLLTGNPVDLPVYDYRSHSRAPQTERVQPHDVILVEGILVFAHDALRERMHHRVYVHTPDDIRLIRRIQRDAVERNRTSDQTIDQYLRSVRPMHEKYVAPSRVHATVELSGTDELERSVSAVMSLV